MVRSCSIQHPRQTTLVHGKPSLSTSHSNSATITLALQTVTYSGILKNPHTTTRYDCKVRIGGKLKLILTFDLETDENIGSNWSSPVENVMSQALRWQTVPIDSNDAFTGKHRVPSTPQSSSPPY